MPNSRHPGILESLLLLVISLILTPFFGIISFVIAIFKFFLGVYSKEVFASYLLNIAIGNDQTGNTICAPLFNMTLLKKNGYLCGNPDETVSGVLGKNEIRGTLTLVGRTLNWLLNKIDPNHSIDSIEKKEDWTIKY